MSEQPDTWRPLGVTVDLSGFADAAGLTGGAREWAGDLRDEFLAHSGKNQTLRRYYDGDVTVSDYGVTADIQNDQTCHWPAKAVDALAERVRLRGLHVDGGDSTLDEIVRASSLIACYNRCNPAKYISGCMAATVTRGPSGARVRFHSAETFTAIPDPDFEDGVVAAGLAIARCERTQWSNGKPVPTVANLHLPGNVWELRQARPNQWTAQPGPTREREPSLYVLAHRPAGTIAPFGRTRITKYVRTLTDDAIRCMWHMQVSGAFYSIAKLWMTGLTDEQFDTFMADKARYQLDRMLLLTDNPLTERAPNVGQLSGNSPQPFVDELRALACQFSGATGVPLNSLGIVQDNPSSAEAIQAAREDICLVAQQDIENDRATLVRVARAAMAIESNTTIDALDASRVGVVVDFADPMLHSLSERSNFVVQTEAVCPGFGQTDYALRLLGVPEDQLAGVRSDMAKASASAAYDAMFGSVMASDGDTA